MQYESLYRPSAAEFPHDNPRVDRGALWIGSPLCLLAAPTETDPDATVPDTATATTTATTTTTTTTTATATTTTTTTAPDLAPEPEPEPAFASDPEPEPDPALASALASAPEPEPALALAPANAPKPATATDAAADDPIATFVRAVTDVALTHGPVETAAHIEALFQSGAFLPESLSPPAQAALFEGNIIETTDEGIRPTESFASARDAWESILRGAAGDLSACGDSTLDVWTADLVARLIANPAKAPTIRRDLRRRGIAAFGMLS